MLPIARKAELRAVRHVRLVSALVTRQGEAQSLMLAKVGEE